MPCYTITTVAVSDRVDNLNLQRLADVLSENGWTIETSEGLRAHIGVGANRMTFTFSGGLMNLEAGREAATLRKELSKIKQQYAAATVKEGLRRMGWKIAKTQTTDGKIRLSARR